MISAVVSARLAGLDRIKSGFTSRFANRLPIFGTSRLPRSLNGRSLSGNAVSSQLDFAWRMRNKAFMAHPVRPDLLERLYAAAGPISKPWLPDSLVPRLAKATQRGVGGVIVVCIEKLLRSCQ